MNSQFRERSEPSKDDAIRQVGITDRFQAEQAIKRWQRAEGDEIDRRTREAVEQLREERDQERENDEREWTDHRDRHTQARDAARRELGIPEPQNHERKEAEQDRAEREQAHSAGPEAEQEFQRRAAEMQRSEPEAPPPFEPDSYVPADRAPPPPEYDMDFEIGD